MRDIFLLSKNTTNFLDIKELNIFDINYISFDIDFSLYDAFIITSKNAIFSLENYPKWQYIPAYAIAPKTASIIEEHGGNLVFTGHSGHGNDFAKELIPKLKHKKVLYIRAKKVVSDLVSILNDNDIKCDELITYETICKEYQVKQRPPKNAIIIFSSPSTIKCFFKNFLWDDSYLAISIGKTTASYFPKNIKYKIANKTSIESCLELAQTIRNN